jgi:hypothetical protein
MRPDDVDLWIDGVPEIVIDVTHRRGRITIRTYGGVDYSFKAGALKKWLNAKDRRA